MVVSSPEKDELFVVVLMEDLGVVAATVAIGLELG